MLTSARRRVCPLNHVVDFHGKTPDVNILARFHRCLRTSGGINVTWLVRSRTCAYIESTWADGNARKERFRSRIKCIWVDVQFY